MTKYILTFAFALGAVASAPAFAADDAAGDERDEIGVYFGLGGGETKLQGYCDFAPSVIEGLARDTLGQAFQGITYTHSCEDSENFVKLFAGYRFLEYVAVEVAWGESDGYANNVDGTIGVNTPLGLTTLAFKGDADLEYSSTSLGVETRMPFTDSFAAFVRAGLHRWERKIVTSGTIAIPATNPTAPPTIMPINDNNTLDGTDPYWGIGMDYRFHSGFSIGADWTRYQGKEYDADTIGGYLKYTY